MRLTWHQTRSALACMGGNHSRRKEEAGSILEARRQTSSATQSRQTVSNCRVTNRHHNNQAKAQINDSRPSILLLALATRMEIESLQPSLAATRTQTRAWTSSGELTAAKQTTVDPGTTREPNMGTRHKELDRYKVAGQDRKQPKCRTRRRGKAAAPPESAKAPKIRSNERLRPRPC